MSHSSPPQPAPLPLRSIYRPSPFEEHPFHWIEAGQSQDVVVFLHGIMAHSMAFRRVLLDSARNYRVIVPDLPGHGHDETFLSSQIPPTLDGLLLWLEALLDTLGHSRIHLVGHSLGATLAYLAALDSSRFSTIESLTLVSPGLQLRIPRWTSPLVEKIPARLASLGATRAGVRLYEPIQWRRARMTDREMDDYLLPIRQPRRIRHMLGLGADIVKKAIPLEKAKYIDRSTLIIWGDRDHLLPLRTAYQLAETIPDSRLEIFKNCGHCPMEDCPTDFHRTLSEFLSPPGLKLAQ